MSYETLYSDSRMALSRGPDGFWLYDKGQGMNLSMKAPTEREAYIDALRYYQRALPEVSARLRVLEGQVEAFVSQFRQDEED